MMGHLSKPAQLRYQIARTAAQYMIEHGIDDFESAKKRALKNLGIKKSTINIVPSCQEVHEAILEHHRLFSGADQLQHLKILREIAYRAMLFLKSFSPMLTGRVLDGSATKSSPIHLHVFADPCELVMIHLINHQIPHKSTEKSVQLSRQKPGLFPGFQFSLAQKAIDVLVFPENNLQFQARCPISGGTMPRADLGVVRTLLEI